jgi:vacuolar-type H+-ATPase subunit H
MTIPGGLPYGGALDAVKRIETALTEQDAARDTAETELSRAHEEAEQLLGAARAAGERTGQERRAALLREADVGAQAIRRGGAAEVETLDRRLTGAREQLVAELMALLLIEEA